MLRREEGVTCNKGPQLESNQGHCSHMICALNIREPCPDVRLYKFFCFNSIYFNVVIPAYFVQLHLSLPDCFYSYGLGVRIIIIE